MKKLLVLLFITQSCYSQQFDTIFNNGFYKSYFSYQLQEPLYVTYKLYKGGGECGRESFNFKNDTELQMADNEEYTKSGYDRGHLANAEDFAYDCQAEETTFRYHNCLPQTPNMNRGIWKTWETKIRKVSQTDSLLIITGGIWGKKRINNMAIPDKCWKVVMSLTTNKVIYCFVCTNTNKSSCRVMSLQELEKLLNRKLLITK